MRSPAAFVSHSKTIDFIFRQQHSADLVTGVSRQLPGRKRWGESMPLSYKDIAELLKIIDASTCEEVILEVEGMRLVMRRGASGGAIASQPVAPSSSTAAPSPLRTQIQSAIPSIAQPTIAGAEEGLLQVRAPMIGTFYRRPSPQDQPFVEVGQRVAKGDPLGLIEVMKLYTTITAPEAGTVEQIPVEDGTLVEFDHVLFAIRTG
jgi:acetyl-CoA carboxylase biotin carboxyl carrier protein